MHITKLTHIIFLFIGSIFCYQAPAQNYEESVSIAEQAYKDGDFYTAGIFYNRALWHDSSDLAIAYQCAESYRYFYNYGQAKRWYQYIDRKDKKNDFPLSEFWLGMMEKSQEDYSNALVHFKKYYTENANKLNDYFVKKSKIEIEACKEAPEIIQKKLKVDITHLSEDGINTAFSEFNARQLGDTMLIFSALRPISKGDFNSYISNAYLSKIYKSQTTNQGWGVPDEIDSKLIDKQNHNANLAFSENYNKVFYTRVNEADNPGMIAEIYSAENIQGKWQKPEKLTSNINLTGYTATQPYYLEMDDYAILFFVSDRPGGQGKLDVWYSIYKNKKYQEPVNLGSIINTPGDEITPYYHKNTGKIYFSSDYHKGLGGFDIFYAHGALNVWTRPENIGYPINSSCNDLYFVVNDLDNDGYFTSNRPGSLFLKSETCCNDIYSYEWEDTLTIHSEKEIAVLPDTTNIEKNIKKLLPISLYFHNDEPNPKSRNTSTTKNYKSLLDEYLAMKYIYMEEYSKSLAGKKKTEAENEIKEFFENYVSKGYSNLTLFANLLLSDLSRGNSIKIIIKGFCSPLTTTEYNLNLAKRRISSIINYVKQVYGGIFIEYLNGTAKNRARLEFIEQPLGESTSAPLVSDNPNDKRNSIYSRAAAFERKVQIISYEAIPTKFEEAYLQFDDSTYDFKTISFGEKAYGVFTFKNTGNANLFISQVETSCGCTAVDWNKDPIPPNGQGQLKINLNTHEDYGYKTETITVYSNSTHEKIILTIKANILPPP